MGSIAVATFVISLDQRGVHALEFFSRRELVTTETLEKAIANKIKKEGAL